MKYDYESTQIGKEENTRSLKSPCASRRFQGMGMTKAIGGELEVMEKLLREEIAGGLSNPLGESDVDEVGEIGYEELNLGDGVFCVIIGLNPQNNYLVGMMLIFGLLRGFGKWRAHVDVMYV
ncbi:hypothetical protein Tco_1428067 [Tanacetum coccineum]